MKKTFLLVIKDDDARVFSVEGPMLDDTPWINRVVAAQKSGRSVRCETPSASLSKAEVVAQMKATFGYAEVDSVSLPPAY